MLYQLSARNVSHGIDPFFSLIITYGVALLGSLIMYIVSGSHQSLTVNVHEINWASVTMGLAIIFVEFGYMMSYKAGAPIASTAITVNTTMTLLLIPIGMLFLQEGFSIRNAVGFVLAVIALYLLNSWSADKKVLKNWDQVLKSCYFVCIWENWIYGILVYFLRTQHIQKLKRTSNSHEFACPLSVSAHIYLAGSTGRFIPRQPSSAPASSNALKPWLSKISSATLPKVVPPVQSYTT